MTQLSTEEIRNRQAFCQCGNRVYLLRTQLYSRGLIDALPEDMKDKAQGMREKGMKPAIITGVCEKCRKIFASLISTGQEEVHYDVVDFRVGGKGQSPIVKIA